MSEQRRPGPGVSWWAVGELRSEAMSWSAGLWSLWVARSSWSPEA